MDLELHDWQPISIEASTNIKQALERMDKTALQILLVVENDRLLGTVTDGDIRRGIINGADLSSPIDQIMNTRPTVGYLDQNQMLWHKLLLQKQLRHLPIIDRDDQIQGLFYQKKKPSVIKNPVVLMLGGLGTRLRPLTENMPKPMLPVGDKPILETIVRHIAEQGFEEFYFCINYLGQQIQQYFGDGSRFGINIHYIEESGRMGTAGALSLIEEQIKLPFIVMNGDLLTKVDLKAMIEFHNHYENLITVGVREYSEQIPYGVIELDEHKVMKLAEKPIYQYFVNGGIYTLDPSVVQKIPAAQFYDMTTLIENALAENQNVGAFPITEYWMDIGQLPDYRQAQADFEQHFNEHNEIS